MIAQKKISLLLLASLFFINYTYAQESSNTAGGTASGSGGTVTYSVGQVVYTTNTGVSGTVAQGVQHAYEIYSLDTKEINMNLSMVIFPNPTSDMLILHIEEFSDIAVNYQLIDSQGKLLNKEKIISSQTEIDLEGLPTSSYFLNVFNKENLSIQSFKIVKK